jgi:CheY-like chemotaxis protein
MALVDIGLPGMDGFEVAQRMRKDRKLKKTVLVAQTGWGQDQDRERTKASGFDHHLVKPVEIGSLREILDGPAGDGRG